MWTPTRLSTLTRMYDRVAGRGIDINTQVVQVHPLSTEISHQMCQFGGMKAQKLEFPDFLRNIHNPNSSRHQIIHKYSTKDMLCCIWEGWGQHVVHLGAPGGGGPFLAQISHQLPACSKSQKYKNILWFPDIILVSDGRETHRLPIPHCQVYTRAWQWGVPTYPLPIPHCWVLM